MVQHVFKNLSSNSSSLYTYSFNPCFSFLATSDRLFSFPLARQNSSRWTIDSSNTPVLTYNYGLKTASIAMICWSLDQHLVEVLQENLANHYSMRLFSHCACWNGCQNLHPLLKLPQVCPLETLQMETIHVDLK